MVSRAGLNPDSLGVRSMLRRLRSLAGAVRSAAAISGVDASFATLDVDADAVLVVSAGLSTAEVEREREIARWPEAAKQPLLRSVNGSRSGDAPIQSRQAVHFATQARPDEGASSS